MAQNELALATGFGNPAGRAVAQALGVLLLEDGIDQRFTIELAQFTLSPFRPKITASRHRHTLLALCRPNVSGRRRGGKSAVAHPPEYLPE
jgi:hypothetical protein